MILQSGHITASFFAPGKYTNVNVIYNEIMSLKKKVDILQQNQDSINAKLSQMDGQMGDIPNKLSNYEQNLKLLIKESGTKME